jgi:hypothetical protein
LPDYPAPLQFIPWETECQESGYTDSNSWFTQGKKKRRLSNAASFRF